jgi:hypothetical protein
LGFLVVLGVELSISYLLGRRSPLEQLCQPIFLFLFFIYFVVLGSELSAYTLSHSTSPFFVMGFFKIGSHELFAQAGLKLKILLPLPSE